MRLCPAWASCRRPRVREAACAALAVAALLAVPAPPASAQGADPDATSFDIRTSLKSSLLLTRSPDDPDLFPADTVVQGFWRARFEPTVRFGSDVTVGGAYEVRLRVFSQDAGLSGGGILPRETPAPYRIRQLDWNLLETPGASAWNEIDRAFVGWHLPAAEITIGRQAIGWGRGVLFSAVDLLSPFTPLEADREWRRGVDAVRADLKLADRTSLDLVSAFGVSLDESVFAARGRGYAGKADIELVGGRRARDWFGGAASSAAVKQAGVHGEVAVFRVEDERAGGVVDRVVVKAIAGGSYRVPIGPGIVTYVEYHYSGFGVESPAQILGALGDPVFLKRYLRGDTHILERHALGVVASSEISPGLTLGGQWIHSPVDGSGVVAPSAIWSFGDKASLLFNLYVPYGAPPAGFVIRSEYGTSGLSGFLQFRLYS